jgi:serine/threonine-protein kinase
MAQKSSGGEPHFPERIGRYDVLLPIASGGMGTVYLARARGVGGFEREVALKLMHSHLKQESTFSHDLIEEAKLAVRIRHPNVVTVIDVGEDPFGIFLVMDYIEGDTLAGLLKRAVVSEHPLPARVALRILMDALSGLHAAHELKGENGRSLEVVHRDFSPQNILVGTDGVARLTDFGIAKAATRIGNTSTGIVKGKIGYMSPEQAKGDPVDRRCDVWAAGVVTWQIVTGRRLYPGENDVSTLLKIVTTTPPRLRELVPDVSPQLDEAVASTLVLDRSSRCATAAAFRQALAAACAASDQRAEPEEVAEWVSRLIGPKLDERRARVAEVEALRARMGKLASPEGEISTPHEPPPVSSMPPTGTAPQATSVGVSLTAVDAVADPNTPGKLELAHPDADATRTDATSVSTGHGPRFRALAPFAPRRLWILGGGVSASLVAAVVAWGLRSEPVARKASSPSEEPSSTASPPPASSPVPAGAPSESPPSPKAPESPPLTVHANATVSSLRVDGHAVAVAHPATDVVTSLMPDEATHDVSIEATSADGRRATGTVPAGAGEVRVTFATPRAPTPRAPGPPAHPASAAAAPAPLAPSPYGQHP